MGIKIVCVFAKSFCKNYMTIKKNIRIELLPYIIFIDFPYLLHNVYRKIRSKNAFKDISFSKSFYVL